jgi:Tfp pilus assembly protein PilX
MMKNRIREERWQSERGAALITALLVSTLLLIVGGALILTTGMASVLAVDSTAELQAYYATEAGVNAAMNVFRGNVQSNPANTAATFRNMATNSTLAPWLNYSTTINGNAAVSLSTNPVMGYSVTVSDPAVPTTPVNRQPPRLLMQVTGYGPKGSSKRMEVMVDRYVFDYQAIASILIRGHDNNSTAMTFAIGNSNSKWYFGHDNSTDPLPAVPVIGVSHANDYNVALAAVNSAQPGTVQGLQPVRQYTQSEMPSFLQTADKARAFLTEMQTTAVREGRYFGTSSGTFGSSTNPLLTFVNGDCTLDGGAGLLIVTGHLELNGTPSFNGLILALGEGTVHRSGGGAGNIMGAFAIGRFARTWQASENGQPHPFLAPSFDTSGGGDSTIAFDSSWIDKALSLAPPRVLAIREKQ